MTDPELRIEAQEERVAVLLHALGADVTNAAFERVSRPRADRLRRKLDEFQQSPPAQHDIDVVLDDFERMFRLAVETQRQALKLHDAEDEEDEQHPAQTRDRRRGGSPPFVPSDDPLEDLNRLQGYQLAGALRDESPRTIALVVAQLEPDKAADVMRQLPDDVRTRGFTAISQQPTAAPALLQRIARTTVVKAVCVDRRVMEQPPAEQKLADMLRAMPKKTRTEMLDAIEQQDSDKARRVMELLYVFDDLSGLTDRSIQKLLSEVDTTTLTVALQDADATIADRVFANLSKRVRETLKEEMQFRGSVAEEKVAEARLGICRIMAQMDQAGELVSGH